MGTGGTLETIQLFHSLCLDPRGTPLLPSSTGAIVVSSTDTILVALGRLVAVSSQNAHQWIHRSSDRLVTPLATQYRSNERPVTPLAAQHRSSERPVTPLAAQHRSSTPLATQNTLAEAAIVGRSLFGYCFYDIIALKRHAVAWFW